MSRLCTALKRDPLLLVAAGAAAGAGRGEGKGAVVGTGASDEARVLHHGRQAKAQVENDDAAVRRWIVGRRMRGGGRVETSRSRRLEEGAATKGGRIVSVVTRNVTRPDGKQNRKEK